VNRGARTILAWTFLAFMLVGSYYVWTGPEAPPIGERAFLEVESAPPVPSRIPSQIASSDADQASTISRSPVAGGIPLAAVRESAPTGPIRDEATSPVRRETDAVSAVDAFGVIEVMPRRVVAGRGGDDSEEGEPEEEVATALRIEVRPGDTLTSIARRHLGDGGRWREIHLANRETIGPDPDALRVGMVLVLPADPPR